MVIRRQLQIACVFLKWVGHPTKLATNTWNGRPGTKHIITVEIRETRVLDVLKYDSIRMRPAVVLIMRTYVSDIGGSQIC